MKLNIMRISDNQFVLTDYDYLFITDKDTTDISNWFYGYNDISYIEMSLIASIMRLKQIIELLDIIYPGSIPALSSNYYITNIRTKKWTRYLKN